MTKLRSIVELGNLYESILRSEVIEEKNSAKKFPKGAFPKAGEEVKEPVTFKDSGPNSVKGLKKNKKAKKNKKNSRKMAVENINSSMQSKFDKLFENVMGDETDMDLGPGVGPESDLDVDMDTDLDTDTDFGGGEDDEVTITMDRETAQKLCDLLHGVLGSEEEAGEDEDSDLEDLEIDTEDGEEEGPSFGEDEDEEEEEDEAMGEGIESEKLADSAGHKLTKAGTVGSIKAGKGKASAEVTDEVSSSTLGDKGSALTKAGNNKVGNLKQGGSLFGN